MTIKSDIGTFQVSVAAMITDNERNILVAKRSPQIAHAAGKWDVISGRLSPGESFEEALKREITEELGESVTIDIVEPYYTFHHTRDDGHEVQGVSYYCQYIRGEIHLNDEHTDFRWVSVEKALRLIKIESLRRDLRRFREKYLKRS